MPVSGMFQFGRFLELAEDTGGEVLASAILQLNK
jgi:hypothetical protein